MSAWQNNSAVDVKISTVAFLTLRASSFRKDIFYQGFQGQILGNFLLKKESQVMWQLLGNKWLLKCANPSYETLDPWPYGPIENPLYSKETIRVYDNNTNIKITWHLCLGSG